MTDGAVKYPFGSALPNQVDKLSPLLEHLLNVEILRLEKSFPDHSVPTNSAKDVGGNVQLGAIDFESDAGFYHIAGEDLGFASKDGPKE
jgi:hypothetical protein